MARRPGLDKARVVQAAAELVDAEGIDALSLSRLAERLGVQTPSLYNHVDGLAGLTRELHLLNARVLGERLTQAAIGKSGAEAVAGIAQVYRAYVKESPGVYLISQRSAARQAPADLELQAVEDRIVQVALAVVASFGLVGEDGLHAVRALRSTVHGFATLEIAGGFGLPLDCDESFRRLIAIVIRGMQPATG